MPAATSTPVLLQIKYNAEPDDAGPDNADLSDAESDDAGLGNAESRC